MEFDFLRQHGFGVCYGAKAVKQKIFELGHCDPIKEITMNENTQATMEFVSQPALDEHGNPIPASGSETTSPQTEVFVAEDHAGHAV